MRWFDRGTLGMAVLMSISAAFAQGDSMSIYYDNTLVCRSAAMQCHIWFKSDGTYRQFEMTATGEGTFHVSGIEGKFTVSAKNGFSETCLIPHRLGGPMGGRPTQCYALAGRKIGDAWSVTANGTALEFSLQAGRQVNSASGFL